MERYFLGSPGRLPAREATMSLTAASPRQTALATSTCQLAGDSSSFLQRLRILKSSKGCAQSSRRFSAFAQASPLHASNLAAARLPGAAEAHVDRVPGVPELPRGSIVGRDSSPARVPRPGARKGKRRGAADVSTAASSCSLAVACPPADQDASSACLRGDDLAGAQQLLERTWQLPSSPRSGAQKPPTSGLAGFVSGVLEKRRQRKSLTLKQRHVSSCPDQDATRHEEAMLPTARVTRAAAGQAGTEEPQETYTTPVELSPEQVAQAKEALVRVVRESDAAAPCSDSRDGAPVAPDLDPSWQAMLEDMDKFLAGSGGLEALSAANNLETSDLAEEEANGPGILVKFPRSDSATLSLSSKGVEMGSRRRSVDGVVRQVWGKREGRRRSLDLGRRMLVRSARKRRLSLGSRVSARSASASSAEEVAQDPVLVSNKQGTAVLIKEERPVQWGGKQEFSGADVARANADAASDQTSTNLDLEALLVGYGWKGDSRMEWDASKKLLDLAEERALLALLDQGRHCLAAQSQLSEKLGRQPTDKELAAEVGLTQKQLQRTMGMHRAARNKLVMHNLGLVITIARLYCSMGYGVDFSSLCQRGVKGLYSAADKFDAGKKCRFSTFASVCVRTVITREIAASMHVRAPTYCSYKFMAIQRAEKELESRLRRKPTVEETAKEAKVGPDQLRLIRKMFLDRPALLHQEVTPTGLSLVEILPDGDDAWEVKGIVPEASERSPAAAEPTSVRYALDDMIDSLKPKEAVVLRQRYGLDGYGERSLAEVGKNLSISREMVRKYEARALAKLKLKERGDFFHSRLNEYA